ncbi:exostosin-like protein, putative [Bodo saltans]|uniref:Exostosin-like protein, putative n=1 Tax=Bodo saltans TaxID=75058 RepID=A0A0S4J988_BODSA|nr:exostosin-like protein, putative [Bodo saltans]|eukprot:CUG87827.1 exostosin-like protein, putative [Bodo saltans]
MKPRRLVFVVAMCVGLTLLLTSVRIPAADVNEVTGSPPTAETSRPPSLSTNALSVAPLPTGKTSTAELKSLVIRGKERGASGDLVTGDGFRLMADYVVDDTTVDLAKAVTDAAECRGHAFQPVVVFVQTHLLLKFTALWLSLTHKCHIRLITHNSDYSSPWEQSNTRWKGGVATTYADQRRDLLGNDDVDVWFAQNAVVVHPKLHPIPIGIENRYNKYGAHYDMYEASLKSSLSAVRKPGSVFVSFNMKTNPKERGQAMQAAKLLAEASPDFVTFYQGAPPKKASPSDYRSALTKMLSEMSKHQFVLAPHGHGVDTHRMWEALYAGCIPIVMRSPMDVLLETLPVLIVDDYSLVTTALLERSAEQLSGRWDAARKTVLSRRHWMNVVRTP